MATDLEAVAKLLERLADRECESQLLAHQRPCTEAAAAIRAATLESAARDIYDGWFCLPGWVPWTRGGNSHRQEEARAKARAAQVRP